MQQQRIRKTSLCDKLQSPKISINGYPTQICFTYNQNSPKQISSFVYNNINSTQNKGSQILSNRCISSCSTSPKFLLSRNSKLHPNFNNMINSVKSISSNGAYEVKKLENITLHNALFIINRSIQECADFHKNFGYSNFEIQNCLISSSGKLILTQRCPSLNLSKFSDETLVVQKIIQQMNKICSPKIFNDFYTYYLRNKTKNRCNFKYMQSLIQSYCACTKIKLQDRFIMDDINIYEGSNKKIYGDRSFKNSKQRTISSMIQSHSSKQTKKNRQLQRRIITQHDIANNVSTQKSKLSKYLQTCKSNNMIKSLRKINDVKKSAYVGPQKKLFKRKMTKSNEITMQFSLKIAKQEDKVKNSQVSTNFKSNSGNHESIREKQDYTDMSITFNQKFGNVLNKKISHKQFMQPQRLAKMPFFSVNLQQVASVESKYQQQPQSAESKLSNNQKLMVQSRIVQNQVDPQQKQKEQKIYQNNQWTRRVNNLLVENAPMIQSFMVGKEQQFNRGPNPQSLGRLARVIAESILPIPMANSRNS